MNVVVFTVPSFSGSGLLINEVTVSNKGKEICRIYLEILVFIKLLTIFDEYRSGALSHT